MKFIDQSGLKMFADQLRLWLQNQIRKSGIRDSIFELVDELPEQGEEGVVYLTTLEKGKPGNQLSEHIWINDKWEKLGELTADIDIPLEKGSAENSVILKGEYEGCSNRAISQNSIAVGVGTTAGLKGYYVNYATATIMYISEVNTELLDSEPSIDNNFINPYEVGDVYSVHYGNNYYNVGTITSINHNKITVNTAIVPTKDAELRYHFYVFDKADKGVVDLGKCTYTEGFENKAYNITAHAEGYGNKSFGKYSHTEGKLNEAGYCAHAEGSANKASGNTSHVEGTDNIASNSNAHAEGRYTEASGYAAHAEGMQTKVDGKAAHVEGRFTYASGEGAHCEGIGKIGSTGTPDPEYGALATAAHAEGQYTKATGPKAHAEGTETIAQGDSSHAEGLRTKALHVYEHAEGKYNVSNTNTIHSVGVGTAESKRKNAHEITNDGKHYILGVGNYDGTKLDGATDVATVINDLKTNGGGSSVTPDWNAKENEAGHIKNRTHYSTTDKYEFEDGEMGENSSDIYVGCYPGGLKDAEPRYYCEIKGFPCNVKIIFDWGDTLSAEYTFSKPEDKVKVMWKDSDNNNYYDLYTYFHIDAYNGKYYFYAHGDGYTNDGYLPEWGPYIVNIEKVNPIDEKYMPSVIAKTKDIKCDWNANENQIGYIKNKPFYEENMYPDVNGEIYVYADNTIELPYYYTAYPNNENYEIRISSINSGIMIEPDSENEISIYSGESSWAKINSEQLFSDITINGVKYKNLSMSDLGIEISFGESGGSDSGNPMLYSANLEAYIEYRIAPKIKKIDSKFLPDSIEKISDINIDVFVFEHMLNPFEITLVYGEDGHNIGVADQQLIDWLYGNNNRMIDNRAIFLNKIAYVVQNEHEFNKLFITSVDIENDIIWANSVAIHKLAY